MSNKDLLDSIKKLREMTGVGFNDCKIALDESKGDIEKSVEFLRKKGIAKASKKMSRTASEGLALVKEYDGQISIIEINSETDFVAKNQDFINFCKELSDINFSSKGNLEILQETKMTNDISVKDINDWATTSETIDKYKERYKEEWQKKLSEVVSKMIRNI